MSDDVSTENPER